MTYQVKKLLGTCLKGEKPAWDSFVLQYSGLVYHTIKKTLSLAVMIVVKDSLLGVAVCCNVVDRTWEF